MAWPTPGSGVATDLDEATIRQVARPLGWDGAEVLAIDRTWSALALVAAPVR